MNEVINGIFNRRSIRAYKPISVEQEKLDIILQAALCGPTAMNRQQTHFAVLRGKTLDRFIEAMGMLASDGRLPFRANEHGTFRPHYDAPVLIIASEDRNNPLGYADCSCALENMFIAATALGLGSCWINCPHPACDYPEVRKVLTEIGGPEENKVYGSAAIGYADAVPREIERKPDRVIWTE